MTHIFHHPTTTTPERRSMESVEDRPMVAGVFGEILIVISAAMLLISGALTLIRAGVGSNLSLPIVSVFGYTHTPWLGIIELAVGVLLLLAGVGQPIRDLATALGVLLIIAAVLIRADFSSMPHQLGIQQSYGWFVLAAGVLATVGGLIPSGWTRRWVRLDRTVPPEA